MTEQNIHDSLLALKSTFEGTNETADCLNLVRRHFGCERSISLLDVGVGSGKSTIELLSALSSAGYDVSATFVGPNIPAERRPVLIASGKVLESRFEDLQFDDAFDVVKATHSIYYLGEPSVSLQALLSVTSVEGVVILTAWSENCVLFKLYDQIFRGSRPSFTAESLAAVAERLGYNIDVCYASGEVDIAWWRGDEEICRAAAHIVSRDESIEITEAGNKLYRYLSSLKAAEVRRNGTLSIRRPIGNT